MAALPISDTTPHMIDVPAPVTLYNTDGSVKSTGRAALVDAYSPYVAEAAANRHYYAIYAGHSDGTFSVLLTRPATVRPVTAPVDCSAQDKKIADAIAVLSA